MPTGVLHLKEIDTDKVTLDGTLSVSGASKLEGAIVADSTLSVGGASTFAADTATSNINVDGTLSVSGQTLIGGDIIPDTNDAYDIGSPEFKIRDLYVSNNSIWVGDDMKISNDKGKIRFRKRKTNVVPKAIINAGANAGHANEQATTDAALAHAGVSKLSDMKLQHWHKFMRTMNRFAKINDIFREDDDDYEESSATDAWKEIGDGSKIYTSSQVGVGTSDPNANLHVKGSFKVESETGFQLIRSGVGGTDPTVIIDTHNFGTDETVNDLTGRNDTKYTKLYRVYGRNSEGVGRSWYWGFANDDYVNMSLAFDGGGAPDPDIAFTFTTASELYCNKVFAALGGNADTATLAAAATKLQTPRKINGVEFDGTKDITLAASSGSSDVNFSSKEAYVKNWVRSQGTGGHYWESGSTGHGYHIYPKNRADMYFRTGSGNGGICGTRENTTPRGYVHWTSSNEIGFLDQRRSWSIRCFQGGAQIYSDLYVNRVGYGNSLDYRIEKSGGNYMTVTTKGSRRSWGGYNIQNQWGIMAHTNGSYCGIYNDQDNEWALHSWRNSHTSLYWNGKEKLRTESWGVRFYGRIYQEGYGYLDEKIDALDARVSSDDRLKTEERYITDATDTLVKLKPQIYDKKADLEHNNPTVRESGLMAQDIYYDAPELRHMVKYHDDAEIPEEKPFVDNDPTKDPDYSMWGSKPASVDYHHLIAYLVQSIKENEDTKNSLKERVAALESKFLKK